MTPAAMIRTTARITMEFSMPGWIGGKRAGGIGLRVTALPVRAESLPEIEPHQFRYFGLRPVRQDTDCAGVCHENTARCRIVRCLKGIARLGTVAVLWCLFSLQEFPCLHLLVTGHDAVTSHTVRAGHGCVRVVESRAVECCRVIERGCRWGCERRG